MNLRSECSEIIDEETIDLLELFRIILKHIYLHFLY